MATKAFDPKNPMDWARTLPGSRTAMGILDEGIGLGDFAYTMAKNMAVTPVAGISGIVDLLRNRNLQSAVDTIERIQSKAGGPQTEKGGEWFDALENVISLGDPLWNTLGKGLDKLATANQFELPNGQRGEFTLGGINPGAALSSGLFAVGQLAGPGKGKGKIPRVKKPNFKRDGVPISDLTDAEKRFSDGEPIYGFHEQDGNPFLIDSLETLRNYQPDQLMALPNKPPKPPKAPKKAAVGTVFDNITDYGEALAMALRNEHLKRTPEGKYVGAPADVISPQLLGRNRRNAVAKVEQGIFNAPWYDRARQASNDASGHNPDVYLFGQHTPESQQASLFANGGAAYSPQAQPSVEMNAFLRQHNAKMLTGEDVVPRMGSQSRNVAKAYVPNADGGYDLYPDRIKLGPKTEPYGDAKNPTIDPLSLYRTANDIWHGRVMGYGANFNRGFTPQEHGFLTGENLILANTAQKKGFGAGVLPDNFQWTPRSAQAATWGAERFAQYKAEAQAIRAKALRKGKKDPGMPTDEELRARASYGIDNAMANHTANDTFEFVTGENVGHLAGLNRADLPTRQNYTNEMGQAYLKTPNGAMRDPMYDAFQMYQYPALSIEGKYLNSAGVMETNPGFTARPLVSLSNSDLGRTASGRARRGGPQMTPSEERSMRFVALLRGFLTGQEAGAYNKFTPGNTTNKHYENTGGRHTADSPEALEAARAAFEEAKLDVIHTGDGLNVGRFPSEFGPQIPGNIIQKRVKAALSGRTGGETVSGRWETGYEGVPWSEKQGTGETTRQVLERLVDDPNYAIPDSLKRLDAGRLRDTMRPMNEIDRALAETKNLPLRQDLLNLREMIAERGLQGVMEYVQKTGGKGLPVLALVPSLAALAGSPSESAPL
jgi:hypothetical protein